MGSFDNLITSTKYFLSKKSEPIFDDYVKIITNFSELTPKIRSPYDLNGREYYASGPLSNGTFICERMTPEEQTKVYNEFVEYYSSFGPVPTPRYKWEYKSMACNSYDLFRLDIYSPGRIVVKSTLPKYSWSAPWMYCSMNKGDYNNPSLNPIDVPINGPREYYFEIDIFENFKQLLQRVSFTGHYGTQTDRKMKTRSVLKAFDDEKHCTEVVWDGKGNWKWLLNSVVIFNTFIPQPEEKIYPYFKLTHGVENPLPDNMNYVVWKVDYVKFSKIIPLK